MDLDVLYRVLVDAMWLFLGGWVVAILAAGFVAFKGDISDNASLKSTAAAARH